jgi:hypothetical protein
MGGSSPETESNEEEDEHDRIDERLDRLVDVLATYLP